MNQRILDRAVNIATRAAMNGNPVEYIEWLAPQTPASGPDGAFAIKYCGPLSDSQAPPWEKD